jgi:hypothetical protein
MHVLAPNEFRVRNAVILFSWGLYLHTAVLFTSSGKKKRTRSCGRESQIFRASSNENGLQRGGSCKVSDSDFVLDAYVRRSKKRLRKRQVMNIRRGTEYGRRGSMQSQRHLE